MLWLIAAGFLFFGVAITGTTILYPLHLARPSFALPGSGSEPGNVAGTVDERVLGGEVSKSVGLLNIPTGVFQVLSMNLLYLALSEATGSQRQRDMPGVGGFGILPCMVLVG